VSLTREDVADLRAGDVVEMRWSSYPDVFVRGPLHENSLGALYVGWLCVRYGEGGGAAYGDGELTVISRAPRPLYVNHDRTEPVPGDVVRFVCDDHPDDSYTNAFLPRSDRDALPWVPLTHGPGERYSDEQADCRHLSGWRMVLLVDGETGEVVP
jgi:hypothetical protein